MGGCARSGSAALFPGIGSEARDREGRCRDPCSRGTVSRCQHCGPVPMISSSLRRKCLYLRMKHLIYDFNPKGVIFRLYLLFCCLIFVFIIIKMLGLGQVFLSLFN